MLLVVIHNNVIRIWNEGNIKNTASIMIKSTMVVLTLPFLADVTIVPKRDYFWHLKYEIDDALHLLDIIISDDACLP